MSQVFFASELSRTDDAQRLSRRASVQRRFADIIERARRHSLYEPALLVMQTPSSTSDIPDPSLPPERVSMMLGLSDVSGIAQVAIYRPVLKDAESAFSVELAKLLEDVHVIRGRVERSLRGESRPCLWDAPMY